MKLDKKSLLLYAVTDRTWLGGDTLANQAEAAIRGGVTFLQLREKMLGHQEFLAQALTLRRITDQYKIPFVINDNIDIAVESGADGAHIGQSDVDITNARTLLGQDKILGVSVQTIEQARLAERLGADYLGVGAVFSTPTKSDADSVSIATLRDICNNVRIPVVAIGGITAQNAKLLAESGICGIAVVSALFAQQDITHAAEELRNIADRVVL